MNLASYLSEHNLSPTVFARQINVAPSTIFRIISGERRPGIEIVAKIREATAGRVDVVDLLQPEQSAST